MTVVVHVAGPELLVDDRYLRQRCAWCGALLLDYDLASIGRPLDEGEDPDDPLPWTPATFKFGGFVAVDDREGWRASSAIEPEPHPDDPDQIQTPDGSCMKLDPAATA